MLSVCIVVNLLLSQRPPRSQRFNLFPPFVSVLSVCSVVNLQSSIFNQQSAIYNPMPPQPPIAKVEPHTTTHQRWTLVDPYAWLQDKTDPQVIAYLEAENAYAKAVMQPTEPLQEQLFQEMRAPHPGR